MNAPAELEISVGGEFDGIGMLALGLHLAGLKHAWLCESDPWRRSILEQRFPGVPVFDDVRAVGAASARPVDVIAGGFPCKGASTAGKREGFGHPETVLWREMRRSIGELRPRYVLIENVANLLALHDGAVWGEVLGDLAALGFDVVWDCLPAAAVGAPHRRDRVFAIATYADGVGWGEGRPALRRREHEAERCGPSPADAPGRRRDQGAELEAGDASSGQPEPARGGEVASDPQGQRRPAGSQLEGERGLEPQPGGAGAAPPDADHGGRQERHGERRRRLDGPPGDDAERRGASVEGRGQALADPPRDAQGGPEAPAGSERERVGGADPGRGVGVDWGEFGPAVKRWESVHGPAPEPLVRRVDDGGARRVERSRLSALGDGVQVQVGLIAGRYIVDRERERLMANQKAAA